MEKTLVTRRSELRTVHANATRELEGIEESFSVIAKIRDEANKLVKEISQDTFKIWWFKFYETEKCRSLITPSVFDGILHIQAHTSGLTGFTENERTAEFIWKVYLHDSYNSKDIKVYNVIYAHYKNYESDIHKKNAEVQEIRNSVPKALDAILASKSNEQTIAQKNTKITELEDEIAKKNVQISNLERKLKTSDQDGAAKDAKIAELEKQLKVFNELKSMIQSVNPQ
jgi:uncharacterized coiled-coil protein SlyX